jgi:ribosomal protein S4E
MISYDLNLKGFMMKFDEGDVVRNVHTGKQSRIVKKETVKSKPENFVVYEDEDGNRFNTDYEKHYELA